MMRLLPKAAIASLAAALVVGCATRDGSREGTQTNWNVCDTDADCERGERCVASKCAPPDVDAGSSGGSAGAAGGSGSEAGAAVVDGGELRGPGGQSSVSVPEDCSATATLTDAEWEACSAPRTVAHAIDTRECGAMEIPQEYRVEPVVVCRMAPDYDFETNPVLLCGVEPYCVRHEDCTDQPHGRCTGSPSAECVYPGVDPPRNCDTDADCQDIPAGRCAPALNQERSCFPNGECLSGRFCFTRPRLCDRDADCVDGPGGTCRKVVSYPRCEYFGCLGDGDCGESERCACRTCVPSTCDGDADCEPGQTCRTQAGCLQAVVGYHCSTDRDSCASGDDCGGVPCEFTGDHWQCRADGCPTVP